MVNCFNKKRRQCIKAQFKLNEYKKFNNKSENDQLLINVDKHKFSRNFIPTNKI